MKKRNMLAIASLATGFVVAAITPSQGAGTDDLGDVNVGNTITTLDHAVAGDGPAVDENPLGLSD